MRLIIITLSCIFCFGTTTNAQVTYDSEHVKIVKEPLKIKMPQIISPNFCEKLHAINIPETISFIDEGRAKFYYITFEIQFNKCGKILSIKPGGNIKAILNIVEQLKQLLQTVKWKIKTTKKKLEIDFTCKLAEGKFRDIVLATPNNFQREEICK
ncbi:MAG: hypothetical protein WAT19_13895 [Ferruginibacter sp.]